MKIVLIIIVCLVVVLALVSLALTVFSLSTHRQSLQAARAWQEDHYDLSWYDPLKKETFAVTAPDGYRLYAERLIKNDAADRCVIISHGYTDNRFGALKYAGLYLDLGYDVIVYDLRGHGVNKKAFCTYSVREREDLTALIGLVRERFSQYRVVGLHGESLGAATTAACLQARPQVDFAVADCGFSDIRDILKNGLSQMHIPGVMLRLTGGWTRILTGCGYRQMRPVDALKENTVPILFFHGTADELIAPWHSERMAAATKGPHRLCLINGAPHAASVLTAPESYRKELTGFLQELRLL